jgi:homoserine O-succinyltransferase
MQRPAHDKITSHIRADDAGGAWRDSNDVLTIALVNNMPDAALRSTERQFCELLAAASEGMLVKLKLFSTPGIVRSDSAEAHIARYYEDFADLQNDPPDGIIVTGTEPKAASLRNEPFWSALSWLVDWVDECRIPGIWSCLAAHAAVLQLDGVERHKLDTKLSGLFDCRISAHRHHVLQGLPARWRVPHSRLYGLRERDLAYGGYDILSRSRDVGADMFIRRGRALQLFFQGHPEYGVASLLGEYRRDLARFRAGERSKPPALPRGYGGAARSSKFIGFATGTRPAAGPASGDSLLDQNAPEDSWSATARRIYFNWLAHVDDRRTMRAAQAQLAIA